MKRFLLLLVLAALPASASDYLLGTITATNSLAKNNATTAVTFTLASDIMLGIQCDGAAYIKQSTITGTLASSTNGVALPTGEMYVTTTHAKAVFLSVLGQTTTVNCRVFQTVLASAGGGAGGSYFPFRVFNPTGADFSGTNLVVASLSTSGAVRANTVTVDGGIVVVNGAITIQDGGMTATGAVAAGSFSTTGAAAFGSLTTTGDVAATGNLSGSTITGSTFHGGGATGVVNFGLVASDLTASEILTDYSNDATTGPTGSSLTIRSSRGNSSVPVNLASGNTLGQVKLGGYGTSVFSNSSVQLTGKTTEAWSNTAQGSSLNICTTANTTTTCTDRVVVGNDGKTTFTAPSGSRAVDLGTDGSRYGVGSGTNAYISSPDGTDIWMGGGDGGIHLASECFRDGTCQTTAASSGVFASYDCNFKTEANNTFGGGDGNYTLCGITWTVANKASAGTFAITNGTGLTITRNNVGNDPYISAKLKAMFPSTIPTAYSARVWVETAPSSYSIANANSWVLIGLSPDGFSNRVVTGPRFAGGVNHWLTVSGGALVTTDTRNLTNNVLGFAVPAWNAISAYSLSNSGDGVYAETSATYRSLPPTQPTPSYTDDWALQLQEASANLTSSVWTRVHVELYR